MAAEDHQGPAEIPIQRARQDAEDEGDQAGQWWALPAVGLAMVATLALVVWWFGYGPTSPAGRARQFVTGLRMGVSKSEVARHVRRHNGRVASLNSQGVRVWFVDRLSPWRKRLGMYERVLVEVNYTSGTLASVQVFQGNGDRDYEQVQIPLSR